LPPKVTAAARTITDEKRLGDLLRQFFERIYRWPVTLRHEFQNPDQLTHLRKPVVPRKNEFGSGQQTWTIPPRTHERNAPGTQSANCQQAMKIVHAHWPQMLRTYNCLFSLIGIKP